MSNKTKLTLEQRSRDRWARLLKRAREEGIPLYHPWRNYDQFLADVGLPPAADYWLVRIGWRKGWEPGNVRWTQTKRREAKKKDPIYRFDWAGWTLAYVKNRDRVSPRI